MFLCIYAWKWDFNKIIEFNWIEVYPVLQIDFNSCITYPESRKYLVESIPILKPENILCKMYK